jgi:hypothetical protein
LRLNGVIPLAMEFIGFEFDVFHLKLGDLDATIVGVAIEACFDREPGSRLGLRDEIHDRSIVPQGDGRASSS